MQESGSLASPGSLGSTGVRESKEVCEVLLEVREVWEAGVVQPARTRTICGDIC